METRGAAPRLSQGPTGNVRESVSVDILHREDVDTGLTHALFLLGIDVSQRQKHGMSWVDLW